MFAWLIWESMFENVPFHTFTQSLIYAAKKRIDSIRSDQIENRLRYINQRPVIIQF